MKPPRLLLLLGFAALPVTANAQSGDVMAMRMQIERNAGREPIGDPRETHAYAICNALRHNGTEILRELPHTQRESGFVAGAFVFGATRCHPGARRLLVGGRFLRGGAAEYLLERPSGRRTNVRVFEMPDSEELQRLDLNVRAPIVFIAIGECVARANPSGVMALLATEVGTPAERAALRAVSPALGGCVPAGVTFRMSPLLTRGYLAEGAFRNAVAQRQGN